MVFSLINIYFKKYWGKADCPQTVFNLRCLSVRRGGYGLYFFLSQSLPVGRQGAKPACGRQAAKKSNRSLPAYRNHGFEGTWYFVQSCYLLLTT